MLYSICKQKDKVRFKVYTRKRDLVKLSEFLEKVDDAVAPSVFNDLKRIIKDVISETERRNAS